MKTPQIYLFVLTSSQDAYKKKSNTRKHLRLVLNNYLHSLGIIVRRLSNGAPMICKSSLNKDIKSISISYSNHVACLALSSMQCVGVDIEIRNKKISRYINEIRENGWNINSLSDWTNGEALSKAYREGFLNRIDYWLNAQRYKVNFDKIAVKSMSVKIPNSTQILDCTLSIASNMEKWYNENIEVYCYNVQ